VDEVSVRAIPLDGEAAGNETVLAAGSEPPPDEVDITEPDTADDATVIEPSEAAT